MRIAAAVAMVILVLATQVAGEVYRVSAGEKDLRAVLKQAKYGDSVLVYPGRYHVQGRLRTGVKLLSVEGPDSTVLWNKRWHILNLRDCDLETQVSGFTFDGIGCNIAIACTSGTPVITDNVIKGSWDGISLQKCNAFIKGNIVEGCNRGIVVNACNPEIVDCRVTKNGEGIYIYSASPIIARCKIVTNGKALFIQGYSYPTIGGTVSTSNDIVGNGYALYNDGRRLSGSLYTDEREVAVATHNYWGSLCPQKDKFTGTVLYSPWVNATHDTTYQECPPAPSGETGQTGQKSGTE
jgi:parallel beta-helix repeat protein